MMKVAGDSDGVVGMPQNREKAPTNPWTRGGQAARVVQVAAPSENPQPNNDCAPSPPDDDLPSKILRQIEFYFSDANILKDQFMLKSVKSNKDGWMKLAIICGFKRIQSLTTDEQVIVNALVNSTQVELSEDGSRIRRKNPLPAWDRLVYTRTVLLSKFPVDEVVSVDSITTMFSSANLPVTLVRVIDSGRDVPPDLTKSASIHGYLGSERCAVVEFESRDVAYQAVTFVRSACPAWYSVILSYNPNKHGTNGDSKDKPVKKERKAKKNSGDPPPSRPQIILTTANNPSVKVVLIREPQVPPNEESVGFEAGWRDVVRVQFASLASGVVGTGAIAEEGLLPLPHSASPPTDKTSRDSTASADFFTPLAPSPPHGHYLPEKPLPVEHLMYLDEAIVSMGPRNGGGGVT